MNENEHNYIELVGFIKGYWQRLDYGIETGELKDSVHIGERYALSNLLRFIGAWDGPEHKDLKELLKKERDASKIN